MRHLYVEEVGVIPAVADLSMVDEKVWELNRINVPESSRGLGHGSRLLRKVTGEADQEGVTLVLGVYPSGSLDYDALVSWYERNGFAFEPGATEWDSQMIRYPNPYCGLCDGGHHPRACPSMKTIRRAEAGL